MREESDTLFLLKKLNCAVLDGSNMCLGCRWENNSGVTKDQKACEYTKL